MTAPKWYDVTLPRERLTDETLQSILDAIGCERYAYGHEKGEGGYEHYQIRYVLKKGSTWNAQKKIWKDLGGHVTPTQENVHNFDYVMKEGEYYRSWETAINKFATLKLLTWQGQAVSSLGDQNERQVTVIISEGNKGKTWLAKYLEATHRMDYCPVNSGDARDYIAYCYKYPNKGYIFDLPMSDGLDDDVHEYRKQIQMWRAIEQIKNGCLYEGRYTPEKKWIEPPKILVFSNHYPPTECLSKDRWKIYKIEKCGAIDILMPYNKD